MPQAYRSYPQDRCGPGIAGLALPQQRSYAVSVQSRRHHQNAQILSQHTLRFKRQCQSKIRMQTTLMELIEDHKPHIPKRRIALEHSRQHAFRHYNNACIPPHPGIHPHTVAYSLSHTLSQTCSHISCGRTGCEASGLQHQNSFTGQPRLLQKAGGTAVVFPAPGSAIRTAAARPIRILFRSGSTCIIGSCFISSLHHLLKVKLKLHLPIIGEFIPDIKRFVAASSYKKTPVP